MERPMKRDDLSRSLVAFEQTSTLISVAELSKGSWLVAGLVPNLSRKPLKKLRPDPDALLRLLLRWRDQATKAGGRIERMVVAFEAGRDGFWLARWLRARGIEAYVIHPTSIPVSREHRRAKTDRLDTGLLMRAVLGWLCGGPEHCSSGPRLITLILGSGDLGSDPGLPTIRGDLGGALAYGQAKIVYDARAAGLAPPLDGPFLKVRDQALLEQDCIVSRSLGHRGRVCIHPDQVPVVNRIYGPDPDEVLFAGKVVDAFTEAQRAGSAAIVVDGVFVDYPIVHKAERIIAR
jgi:hypothetical protein